MAPGPKALAAVIVVAVVVGAAYYIYTASQAPGPVTRALPTSFTVNGRTYEFNYTATNSTEWEKGLMNTKVTDSTTMLFAFPYSAQWRFWMYDTNTSLDMIWINATGSSGRVVYLVTSAQPCYVSASCTVYTPTSAANYVIEARAGFVAKNGVSVGTTVAFH